MSRISRLEEQIRGQSKQIYQLINWMNVLDRGDDMNREAVEAILEYLISKDEKKSPAKRNPHAKAKKK